MHAAQSPPVERLWYEMQLTTRPHVHDSVVTIYQDGSLPGYRMLLQSLKHKLYMPSCWSLQKLIIFKEHARAENVQCGSSLAACCFLFTYDFLAVC